MGRPALTDRHPAALRSGAAFVFVSLQAFAHHDTLVILNVNPPPPVGCLPPPDHSLELSTGRVWDYKGDCYAHRALRGHLAPSHDGRGRDGHGYRTEGNRSREERDAIGARGWREGDAARRGGGGGGRGEGGGVGLDGSPPLYSEASTAMPAAILSSVVSWTICQPSYTKYHVYETPPPCRECIHPPGRVFFFHVDLDLICCARSTRLLFPGSVR